MLNMYIYMMYKCTKLTHIRQWFLDSPPDGSKLLTTETPGGEYTTSESSSILDGTTSKEYTQEQVPPSENAQDLKDITQHILCQI